jgi:sucrose-6-phosphate hydrolase SacC (GH32 family)
MNDPRGLIHHGGEYHLFYQHVPHDPTHALSHFNFPVYTVFGRLV